MVVLSVYVCVFLHIFGIFVRLSASCHVVTCFFVDFSLVTQLSLFYFIRYIIGDMQLFFVIVLSVYVCVYLHHHIVSLWCSLCHVGVSLLLLLLFFLTHGTHQTCGMSSD